MSAGEKKHPGNVPDQTERARKLLEAKELILKGASVRAASEKVCLGQGYVGKIASREGWCAQRTPYQELIDLASCDLPRERERHRQRVYNKASAAVVALKWKPSKSAQFASTLDTLDKICRRCLDLDRAAGGLNVAILATALSPKD